ncbi:hypothetical protein B0T20DRAFT_266806 [Sordaria brevicollis]|uniref:Uncharacterized protein n=1 Tax=Sordaria brevicollis TaxID=83679 RepID=A0AAE0PA99_SORBR|nr:hypothetical protein B0T20DRAFT_266806 [Sordaria brevicollis]
MQLTNYFLSKSFFLPLLQLTTHLPLTHAQPPLTTNSEGLGFIHIPALETLPSEVTVYGSIVTAAPSSTVFSLDCKTDDDNDENKSPTESIDYCSWLGGLVTKQSKDSITISGHTTEGLTSWLEYDNTFTQTVSTTETSWTDGSVTGVEATYAKAKCTFWPVDGYPQTVAHQTSCTGAITVGQLYNKTLGTGSTALIASEWTTKLNETLNTSWSGFESTRSLVRVTVTGGWDNLEGITGTGTSEISMVTGTVTPSESGAEGEVSSTSSAEGGGSRPSAGVEAPIMAMVVGVAGFVGGAAVLL